MGPTREGEKPPGVGGVLSLEEGLLSTGRMLRTVGVCVYCMCCASAQKVFWFQSLMVKNNNHRQIASKYECGHEAV